MITKQSLLSVEQWDNHTQSQYTAYSTIEARTRIFRKHLNHKDSSSWASVSRGRQMILTLEAHGWLKKIEFHRFHPLNLMSIHSELKEFAGGIRQYLLNSVLSWCLYFHCLKFINMMVLNLSFASIQTCGKGTNTVFFHLSGSNALLLIPYDPTGRLSIVLYRLQCRYL